MEYEYTNREHVLSKVFDQTEGENLKYSPTYTTQYSIQQAILIRAQKHNVIA